jgi:hypothetical protein
MKIIKWFIFISMMVLLPVSAHHAFAGDGKIVTGPPHKIDLNLYYNYNETDLNLFRDAFIEASKLMYNATDGMFQFGTIRVSNNSAFQNKADLWVQPGSGGASSGGFGILGIPGVHVTIYQNTHRYTAEDGPGGNERGQFGIVHELGHHAFDLRNEYHGGPPTYSGGRYCISTSSSVACIMDGGTTVHPTHHRTEWCTDPADSLSTAHVTSPENHQEYEHGEACWETLVDYCASEYGLTLSEPTSVDTSLPSGHVDPAWIVIGDQLRYVICVDKSYSMVGDKMTKAKAGADLFVDLGHEAESEYVAVTSFSGGASYDPAADVDFSLTEVTTSTVKDNARTAIGLISVENNTAIGDGMRKSLNELETLPQDDANVESIVLLSDGVHNYGSETPAAVIPDLRDRGVRVFTIGLGDPLATTYPLDEDALLDIADQTGGLYTHAPTEADLATIYTAYCAEIRGADVCAEDTGEMAPGGSGEHTALIDSFTQEATFVLHWPIGKGLFYSELRMPDGTTVNASNVASYPNITHTRRGFYDFYRVKSPQKGKWKFRVRIPKPDIVYMKRLQATMKVDTSRFRYTTQVLAEARGVDFSVFSKDVLFKYPQVPIIQAMVSAGVPVAKAIVSGVITRPDGTRVNIRLYDDGTHGETLADDGIYGNRFPGYTQNGSYKIQLAVNNINGVEATPDEVPKGWKAKPIPPFHRVSKNTIIVRGIPADLPVPKIDKVDPNSGKPGETLKVKISGSNFIKNCVVTFSGAGIAIHKLVFNNANLLTADISIAANASGGKRNVTVTNPGGKKDTAYRAFKVVGVFHRRGLSAHIGLTIPHGTLNTFYNSALSLAGDLEYRLTPSLSAEAIVGFNRFKSNLFDPIYWWNISGNLKLYLPGATTRWFINGGPGVYIPETGSAKFGFNAGGGVSAELIPALLLEASYNFHTIFTQVSNTYFSTVWFGVKIRF